MLSKSNFFKTTLRSTIDCGRFLTSAHEGPNIGAMVIGNHVHFRSQMGPSTKIRVIPAKIGKDPR